MNPAVVDVVVTGFYAAGGRKVEDLTLRIWEQSRGDLPDVYMPAGTHLGEVVALARIRDLDRLPPVPKQFRSAYIDRIPRLGHDPACECEGVGWLEVTDPTRPGRFAARRPGPVVALPEPTLAAIGSGPPEVVRRGLEQIRHRSEAALGDQPVRRAWPAPAERPPWAKPDEAYWADLERRRTETDPQPEPNPQSDTEEKK